MSIHAKATVYVGDVGHSFPRSADGPGPGRQRAGVGEESPPRNLDFRRAAGDGDDQGSGADLSPSLIETRAAAGTRMFSQTPDSRHPQSLFRKAKRDRAPPSIALSFRLPIEGQLAESSEGGSGNRGPQVVHDLSCPQSEQASSNFPRLRGGLGVRVQRRWG
jgi:hypothetical protein